MRGKLMKKTTPDDPRARRTVNPLVKGLRRIATSDGAVLGRLGPLGPQGTMVSIIAPAVS